MHKTSMAPAGTGARAREFRPLEDRRWDELVARHPHSSVFHTRAWLEALRRTYGYEAVAFTGSPEAGPLEDAAVFCLVDSWLTGRRLVSLPFSDHCDLLAAGEGGWPDLLAALERVARRERLDYVEFRPSRPTGWSECVKETGFRHDVCHYVTHSLDLRPDLDTLFRNLHKDSTQRKVRRAEREKLVYEEGRSPAHLAAFYGLTVQTRRRQGLPPQPRCWFRNLADCFGEALKIRIARHGERPAAAILTLRHRDTLVYKYGCSDTRHNALGGTQLLFWKTIEEGKREEARLLDLGRSDPVNSGLITFKDRLGAARDMLEYCRMTLGRPAEARFAAPQGWKYMLLARFMPAVPDRLLRLAGELLYKHIG